MTASRILSKRLGKTPPTPDSPRPADTTAPAAPGTPVVSSIVADSATITFAASVSSDVVGYAAFLDGGSTPYAYSNGNVASITLRGLLPGSHGVVVKAFDGAGNFSAESVTYYGYFRVDERHIPSADGAFIKNLYAVEFNSTNPGTTQSSGTVTFNDDNYSFTCAVAEGVSGRALITTPNFSLKAGNIYMLAITFGAVVNVSNSTNKPLLVFGAAPALDFGSLDISQAEIVPNKTNCIIFQPTIDSTIQWRIGLGTNSAGTAPAGGAILEVSDIMLLGPDSIKSAVPPRFVPPFSTYRSLDQRDGSLSISSTKGAAVFTKQIDADEPGLSIAIFGDSYVNDTSDYPAQLQALTSPRIGVWYQKNISNGVTVAGTRPSAFLERFQSKMQVLIDKGAKPKYVLLQSSLNTVNITDEATRAAAIDTDILAIENAAKWAAHKGITPILTLIAPFKTGAGAGWVTLNKWASVISHDTKIQNLATSLKCQVFNLRAPVADPLDEYKLSATYDNGDNIHPNAAGFIEIAKALQSLILRIDSAKSHR